MVRKLRVTIGVLFYLAALGVLAYGISRKLLILNDDPDYGTAALCGFAAVGLCCIGYGFVNPAGWRDQ
jgi:hypothetical protein